MATSTYTVVWHDVWALRASRHSRADQDRWVTGVDVRLAAGSVTVTSDDRIDEVAVRDAVEVAGYEIVV